MNNKSFFLFFYFFSPSFFCVFLKEQNSVINNHLEYISSRWLCTAASSCAISPHWFHADVCKTAVYRIDTLLFGIFGNITQGQRDHPFNYQPHYFSFSAQVSFFGFVFFCFYEIFYIIPGLQDEKLTTKPLTNRLDATGSLSLCSLYYRYIHTRPNV